MNQNYSETIKQHYHHPLNAGKLANPTHTAEQINPLCGDETKIYLRIEKDFIRDISHETRGCMICVASASVVSEYARGKRLEELKRFSVQDVAKLLHSPISPARDSCATLIVDVLKK